MIPIRVINLILQSTFLFYGLFLIIRLFKTPVPSPVWQWFVILCISVWLWVSGRFLESILYLFIPHNALYVFAANYQYIGLSMSSTSYFIWNLYLASKSSIADNYWFRTFIFLIPLAVILLAFTNQYHHLFYIKLVMGERVIHGSLFLPCLLSLFVILLLGFCIAAVNIIRQGDQIVLKLLLFMAIPFLPASALIIRSISGVDLLDVTPLVMAFSYYFLYLVIFKYKYVNISAASIHAVLAQTAHPVCIFNCTTGSFSYYNQAAQESYTAALREMAASDAFTSHASALSQSSPASWEGYYAGVYLRVSLQLWENPNTLLVTATDLTDYDRDLKALNEQIALLEKASSELDEENRNIDAYIDALTQATDVHYQQGRLSVVYELIQTSYEQVSYNFNRLQQEDPAADAHALLEDNMQCIRQCLKDIRSTVSLLKE